MESLGPLIEALKGFGTAAPVIGLFVWLFYTERSERREISAQLLKLTTEQIEAEKEMTSALTVLAAKVAK